MNWYHRKVEELNLWDPTVKLLKYLSLMALIDLSWMARFFFLINCQTVTCDVEKISSKFFKQFY